MGLKPLTPTALLEGRPWGGLMDAPVESLAFRNSTSEPALLGQNEGKAETGNGLVIFQFDCDGEIVDGGRIGNVDG